VLTWADSPRAVPSLLFRNHQWICGRVGSGAGMTLEDTGVRGGTARAGRAGCPLPIWNGSDERVFGQGPSSAILGARAEWAALRCWW